MTCPHPVRLVAGSMPHARGYEDQGGEHATTRQLQPRQPPSSGYGGAKDLLCHDQISLHVQVNIPVLVLGSGVKETARGKPSLKSKLTHYRQSTLRANCALLCEQRA